MFNQRSKHVEGSAEDIIEQMVTNTEGLMDEEKDKLRRLFIK